MVSKENYEPLKFVDSLDSREHIVLLYEDHKYARMIEFHFLKNGLLKGERCVYATHDNPKIIEDEMRTSGIDIDAFMKRNLLHICQIPNPMDDPDGHVKGAEKIINMILTASQHPLRIVGRLVPNLNTEESISAELEIERYTHAAFNNFQFSLMCPYQLENIDVSTRCQWLKDLLKNHHVAIFAPKGGKGIGLSLRSWKQTVSGGTLDK